MQGKERRKIWKQNLVPCSYTVENQNYKRTRHAENMYSLYFYERSPVRFIVLNKKKVFLSTQI